MFRRKSTEPTETDEVDELIARGKGRPTPKRNEAQANRKQRMQTPRTRKEAAKVARERRYEARMKTREALDTGNEKYLPVRDKGPVRRWCRDFIDSRWNFAEFLLPILAVVLVLTFISQPWTWAALSLIWIVTILGVFGDTLYVWWKVRRKLASDFADENTRGAVSYAILRSTQMRRFRLPKPQVERGADV